MRLLLIHLQRITGNLELLLVDLIDGILVALLASSGRAAVRYWRRTLAWLELDRRIRFSLDERIPVDICPRLRYTRVEAGAPPLSRRVSIGADAVGAVESLPSPRAWVPASFCLM